MRKTALLVFSCFSTLALTTPI
jgi:beta-glucosidase/6-phospho-beta-glucosidase/beta-galactosidase